MSCCNHCLHDVLQEVLNEVRLIRKLLSPISRPMSVGRTTLVREDDVMSKMVYEQEFGNLPPAEGRNKDIAKGVFVVEENGLETSRFDVAYDLQTREPLNKQEWKAEKHTDAAPNSVTLKLAYVDDDNNQTEFTEFNFGTPTDTITPDAPESIGRTTLVREED